MKKEYNKNKDITGVVVIGVFLVCFLTSIIIASSLIFLFNVYKTLPLPHELADIQPSLVTKVYAADSSLIHEFSVERRFWVHIDSVPKIIKDAVVSIEDRRFYKHWGIDPIRLVSSTVANITRKRYSQGASTITQQLARNLYFTQRKTVARKIREILTSVQLEKYYTKDEILELYLNTIYFGGGTYGISAAAQQYFSKSIAEINLNEAAVLAGIIQLPEHHRPDRDRNLERIRARRRVVLRSMLREELISEDQFEYTDALDVPSNPFVPTSGVAPYFVEHVRREMERRFGADVLYNSGLSIYTTLDRVAQEQAEVAVREHLNRLRPEIEHSPDAVDEELPIEASVVAMCVKTGAVRVMVGGRDFERSKFNRATQGLRQPGSAFKPFVYAAAMNHGYTPASLVNDRPITIIDEFRGDAWRPENHDREFYGEITIREALRRSVNLVTVQVIQDIGPRRVVDIARVMGMSNSIPPVLALSMGTCEATNLEITRAYSAFGNLGLLPDVHFVEKIKDRNGRVIFENKINSVQVIESHLAEIMTNMMQDVVVRGTGASIRASGWTRPAAGKTGTTNNYTDAWFVGYTPQISCGVWVGTDRSISMGRGITGSRGAIPIWLPVMRSLHRDLPVQDFETTGILEVKEVCSVSRGLAGIYCPNPYNEFFMPEVFPDVCTMHAVTSVRDTSNMLKFFGTPPQNNTSDNSGLMF